MMTIIEKERVAQNLTGQISKMKGLIGVGDRERTPNGFEIEVRLWMRQREEAQKGEGEENITKDGEAHDLSLQENNTSGVAIIVDKELHVLFLPYII